MAHQPADYLGIKIWGEMMHSSPAFIADEQARAAKDSAPVNAIYKGHGGEWRTVDDLAETHFIREVYAERLKAK